MASDASFIIYVALRNRVNEWRLARAIHQREDIYCMVGPMGEGEQWQFPPGTLVRRKLKILANGKEEMVAIAI